ncbi:MAG: methionine ABC transporter permease [Erysipelotrichales bacterium]
MDINIDETIKATIDTAYMSFISTFFVAVFGLILGIILFVSNEDGLSPNKFIYKITNGFVNIFRSIPFIILIIILLPFTKIFVGTIIGSKAFLPGLIIAASPLYGRMVENSFKEIDYGVIEASLAMGAKKSTIIYRVLIRESLPSLVNNLTITCVSIIGYSAMAGIIGGGGLGELARRYGYVGNNNVMTFIATLIALVLVLIVQFIGDYISKKFNKREVN